MNDIILVVLLICALPVILTIWIIRKIVLNSAEIESLQEQIDKLRSKVLTLSAPPAEQVNKGATPSAQPVTQPAPRFKPVAEPTVVVPPIQPQPSPSVAPQPHVFAQEPIHVKPPTLQYEAPEHVEASWNEALPKIDWEQFMGIKLFAWLGGLLFFFAVAFLVKYSFENNLIPPSMRIATGYLSGIGLLIGGFYLLKREFEVLAKTLCATGILVLYGVTFAAHTFYHFFGDPGTFPVFSLMVLITATAFLMAVTLDAQVVAILGLVGGFLTPLLLSTGQDNPVGLFGYIAILDIGLLLVALRTHWSHLVFMAAIGTVLMQCGWASRFFGVEKVYTAMTIFLGFEALFLLAFSKFKKPGILDKWHSMAAVIMPVVTLLFSFWLFSFPELGKRPGLIFSFVLAADAGFILLALLENRLAQVHLLAGSVVFIELCMWTINFGDITLLYWGMGFYFAFAVLHSVFPLVLRKIRPEIKMHPVGQFFPAIALGLTLLWIFNHPQVPVVIWAGIFLFDVLAIIIAICASSILTIVPVLLLTLIGIGASIFKLSAELAGLPTLIGLLGCFAVFFFFVGIFAAKKIAKSIDRSDGIAGSSQIEWVNHIPTLSSFLPFLLLILVVLQLPILNPSPIFGLALLLIVLLLAVSRYAKLEWLSCVGLISMLCLEHVWHAQYFLKVTNPWIPLDWYIFFAAVFLIYPFLFRKELETSVVPWIASAMSLASHFPLIYSVVKHSFPTFQPYMGALPAICIIPPLLSLLYVIKNFSSESPTRDSVLAWFGGVTLFFVTLIFPIQFSAHWLTIAWALEGVALLWLYHRLPQWGLRLTGISLLVVAFGRLTFSQVIWNYLPQTDNRIINTYLYTYGTVTLCLFAGAKLLYPPRHKISEVNVMGLLYSLGTILAFILLNIEIANYFSVGRSRPFEFSDNFAREMTCSIAWALFAIGLLLAGMIKSARQARYVSIALLSLTVLKLLLHDFSHLDQLHRIGATIGVAIILLVASFLFQKYFNLTKHNNEQAAA